MIIRYERAGNCMWHVDCVNRLGGVMRVVSHEKKSSTLECMHCGMRGSYPVGSVGEVTVEAHGEQG